jgi:hypothetical protein
LWRSTVLSLFALAGSIALLAQWNQRATSVTARTGGEARMKQPSAVTIPPRHVFERSQAGKPRSEIPPAAAEASGDLRMAPEPGGLPISGRVLDASGGEIVGALLQARGLDGQALGSALSTRDGRFSLSVASSTVELSASADGYSSDVRRIDAPYGGLVLSLTPASTVEGRVVAADTGAGVAGVRVIATSLDDAHASARGSQSDGSGAFALAGLSAGRYEIAGIAPEWRSEALSLSVAPGQALASVTLSVARAVTLHARLTLTGSGPCEQGLLDLFGPVTSSTFADQNGNIVVQGLVPGRYQAVATCSRALSSTELLEVGSEPLSREWRLEPGLTLSGTLVTHGGEPIAGESIVLTPIGEPLHRAGAACTTDADGAFSCGGLIAGDYDCVAGDDAPVRASVRAEGTQPVALRREPAGALRVAVSSRDGSTPGPLSVVASRVGGGPIFSHRKDGFYTFELKPGRYRVHIEECPDIAADVTLSHDGELIELSLELPATTTISGSVVDAQGSAVADASIHALMSGSELAAFSRSGAPALSDADGRFTIEGLLPRRYDLLVTSDSGKGQIEAVAAGMQHARIRLAAETASSPPRAQQQGIAELR